MKLEPDMHIGMHLVSFGKSGVTWRRIWPPRASTTRRWWRAHLEDPAVVGSSSGGSRCVYVCIYVCVYVCVCVCGGVGGVQRRRWLAAATARQGHAAWTAKRWRAAATARQWQPVACSGDGQVVGAAVAPAPFFVFKNKLR
jgi:hypothetical protein